MTTYPPAPEPPEPELPKDDENAWSPNAESSPRPDPDQAPFSGNDDGTPGGFTEGPPVGGAPGGTPGQFGGRPETTPADFARPEATPEQPLGGPEGNPDGFSDTGEGAPRAVPETPPPAGIPPAPPLPPPSGAGYSPYAGVGSVPPPPPPPPPYNGDGPLHGRQEVKNGLGKAALVLGIIAVALSFVPGLNAFSWPLGVLAIVFGAIGWARANKGQATNKPFAITGLVLGIVSFFTFCLIYVIIGAGGTATMYNTAPM
ncbi:hypothetical protein SAMN05216298_2535 [Glycomyces sambucus]|uniref:DUF4190 domain-containing protein n=1 Tax=Glycomyces sambucus TaxID=380244 RepID=A0A1G9H005_9ACTN|nr:DUF4190 domain-containing protein [Glycomyces sambucus]SDL06300.1 hypothetical protein SAMN05216298_2535 [Glycomyces sambucus]